MHWNISMNVLWCSLFCQMECIQIIVLYMLLCCLQLFCVIYTISFLKNALLTLRSEKVTLQKYLLKGCSAVQKFRLSECTALEILTRILTWCQQSITIGELIVRAAKHLFKCYMQGVDMMNLSSAISHFLNCFLGSYPTPHAQVNAEEVGIFCPSVQVDAGFSGATADCPAHPSPLPLSGLVVEQQPWELVTWGSVPAFSSQFILVT